MICFISSLSGTAQTDTSVVAPQFGNSEDEFFSYIENNLNQSQLKTVARSGEYPTVEFSIDTFGRPVNIEVYATGNQTLINVLKDGIRNMPDWTPGMKDMQKTEVRLVYLLWIRQDAAGFFIVDKGKPLPPPDKDTSGLKKMILGCAVFTSLAYIFGIVMN